MPSRVSDRDMGMKALMALAAQIADEAPCVVVGIAGGQMHKTAGISVAELAATHEYGLGVPERSFLRATVDKGRERYLASMQKAMKATVVYASKHKSSWDPLKSVSLKRLALVIEGDVKAAIAAGIPPPNAQRTIDKKGSSTPLIDTGQLRRSILGQVRSIKGETRSGRQG
jgi:hypothetical protein